MQTGKEKLLGFQKIIKEPRRTWAVCSLRFFFTLEVCLRQEEDIPLQESQQPQSSMCRIRDPSVPSSVHSADFLKCCLA